MAEEAKTKNLVGKIEKLIVDGNKQVIDRIGRLEEGQEELKDGLRELRKGQENLRKEIFGKLQSVHASLKTEISVTAVAVQETVREEVKRVSDKLDEHMRQPVHAGA